MWKLLDKKGNILYQHTHAHSLLSFPKSHSCPGRACRNKIQAVLFSMLTWLLALSAPAPALSLGHLPRDCSLPFIFSLASQGNFQTPCSFHRAKGVELIIQQFPLEHPPLHPTPARPLGSPFSFSAPYGTLPRTASQEQEGLQEEAKMGESSGIFRAMKSQKQSWGRLVHGGWGWGELAWCPYCSGMCQNHPRSDRSPPKHLRVCPQNAHCWNMAISESLHLMTWERPKGCQHKGRTDGHFSP